MRTIGRELRAGRLNLQALRLVAPYTLIKRIATSGLGPGCAKTFFLPQKLHATGDDPHRYDGLSIFLLYRVRSQPGRKLGPR